MFVPCVVADSFEGVGARVVVVVARTRVGLTWHRVLGLEGEGDGGEGIWVR